MLIKNGQDYSVLNFIFKFIYLLTKYTKRQVF